MKILWILALLNLICIIGTSGQTSERDICNLPPVIGRCKAFFRRWFYNSKTKQCEPFIYGGCEGNANNFKTEQECKNACATPSFKEFLKTRNNDAILEIIKNEGKLALMLQDVESNPLSRLFAFLGNSLYIKRVGLNALNALLAIQEFGRIINASGQELLDIIRNELGPDGMVFESCSRRPTLPDEPLRIPTRFDCCPLPNILCRGSREKRQVSPEYRTIDGSCNCKNDPNMGRSRRAFKRMLPPDYGDDFNSPRLNSNGKPLPSARRITSKLFEELPGNFSRILTQLHFSVGQFVDHDHDRTPISKILAPNGTLQNIYCGEDGCDKSSNPNCFPIKVPKNDPFFTNSCIPFVRSQIFFNDWCFPGKRQQGNALTAWMDASQVYGSTKEELDKVREESLDRGKMRTSVNPLHPTSCGSLLPTRDDPECRNTDDTIKCFLAGDERVNEQIGLTAMHTIFVRLHNYFEERLHEENPMWTGERLFQETRRLIIAVWQNVVYGEYLPPLLGDKLMKEKGLRLLKGKKCFKGYDCVNFQGDVRNVFATAAFRHGHSEISRALNYNNAAFDRQMDIPFSTVMFDPNTIYPKYFQQSTCGVDAIILGVSNDFSYNIDRFFTRQLTRHLFTSTPPSGMGLDLIALNIQRGRDHGIPGYTEWRKVCNLSVPTSFDDMEGIGKGFRNKLKMLYKKVEDVDLFTAGIAEKRNRGSILGPTFACIIGHHFQNVKFADRFWFERCTPETFSGKRLKSIRQYTFGRLYCDTLDFVETIQPFPMMIPIDEASAKLGISKQRLRQRYSLYRRSDNNRVPCNQLPEIDFSLWKE